MRISTTVVFSKESSVTRMTPNDFDGDQQVVLTHDSLFGIDSWSQITFFVPGVEAADALVAALRGCFPKAVAAAERPCSNVACQLIGSHIPSCRAESEPPSASGEIPVEEPLATLTIPPISGDEEPLF